MNTRPKPPADYDDNPPLDDDFFARARPALDDPELAHIPARHSHRYRQALHSILSAHEAGLPMDDALNQAKAPLAAE